MKSHHDVAIDWVSGRGAPPKRDVVRGGRMYHTGASIWSYGPHWEIARWVRSSTGESAVLMRTDTYSPSTGKHHHHVRSALQQHGHGVRVFHINPVGGDSFPRAERIYLDKIRDAWDSAKKPRIRQRTRDDHVLTAERWHVEMCAFNEFYQCSWPCERDTSFEGTLARVMIERGIGGDDAR